ncbi:hypothetical protein BLNAU_16102 [Blattamonas nauphoetae]|uniref:Uncharacterized protein n=1 Tax=Blattamonas nauphoetae TaxID=2049346 RepID=A0ABQ9X8S6_9EUKA|nr:hypothetical protein BLNAU_16102 [Blattamonas nauphoetae]
MSFLLSNRLRARPSFSRHPDIILLFEQHQHAVERIVHLFVCENIQKNYDSLHQRKQQFILLCHTSLNRHKPHQPPLDLLFERTLRTNPLEFFHNSHNADMDLPPTLLNTSLCGTFRLFLFFPPPLVVRFFLPVLSSHVDSSWFVDSWKEMMSSLLLTTAPFGDLHSVRELYRSVGQSSCHCEDTSTESCVTYDCESIEWLNIPTGFDSALALQIQPSVVIDKCDKHSPFSKDLSKFLSDDASDVCDGVCHVASLLFLNWEEDRSVSEHEQAVIFRSLVATVKVQPTFGLSLETKIVTFLESVDPKDEESADAFLSTIASFSDKSMTDFVQAIVTLISTSNKAIITSTMMMLQRLPLMCSDEVLFALVKSDLTSLTEFAVEDGDERQTVPETIFKKVLSPSEMYIWAILFERSQNTMSTEKE